MGMGKTGIIWDFDGIPMEMRIPRMGMGIKTGSGKTLHTVTSKHLQQCS